MKIITKSKIMEFMAGHPKLVAVALSVGLTLAVTAVIGIAGQPHQAYAFRSGCTTSLRDC